jgi:hypothetical protein
MLSEGQRIGEHYEMERFLGQDALRAPGDRWCHRPAGYDENTAAGGRDVT